MDMYSRMYEITQAKNRRKQMTPGEMMRFYGLNAQRRESGIERFRAFLSKTLTAFQHRAGSAMPSGAPTLAPAYRCS